MKSDEIIAKLNKELPEGVIATGSNYPKVLRIATGCFSFDLATGGGYPQGRVSINYGLESSTKTLHSMKAAVYVQRHCLSCGYLKDKCGCEHPRHKKPVLFDIEAVYDPLWYAACGVDPEEIIVIRPAYAEQAVDICNELAYADDVGLIVFDSIAALAGVKLATNSAEKADVGGSSILVTTMVKKLGIAMAARERAKDPLSVILINQTRFKIGVMFGDPETMPCGNSIKFASSLTVRFYGKDWNEPKFSKIKPLGKELSCIIKKWKVPIHSKSIEYNMFTNDFNGFKAGEQNSWGAVSNYLKDYGLITKEKTKWQAFGIPFDKLGDIEDLYLGDLEFKAKCDNTVIDRELNNGYIEAQV